MKKRLLKKQTKAPKQQLLENEDKLQPGQFMMDGTIYNSFEDMVFNGLTGIERDIVVGAILTSITDKEVMMKQKDGKSGFTIKANK